jgi:hypothetical protein
MPPDDLTPPGESGARAPGCARQDGRTEVKRRRVLGSAVLLGALAASGVSPAQQQFFRIGTGGVGGTYFPIGGIVASAISEASGAGIRGLVASAVASHGALANVNAIGAGQIEAGLTQANVAYWAWSGTGLFAGRPRLEDLRLLANLYPESVQIVVRRDSGIRSVGDLRGRRVSLDEPGSGTLIDARFVLEAHDLTEADLQAEYLKMGPAADRMRDGALDAFFVVAGWPVGAISELSESLGGVDLVPIDGQPAERLMQRHEFFARDVIPAGAYAGSVETATVAVGAQFVASSRLPDDLAYAVVRSLWNDNTRKLLDTGHPKGRQIRMESALAGAGIPVHDGAARFYREAGVLR